MELNVRYVCSVRRSQKFQSLFGMSWKTVVLLVACLVATYGANIVDDDPPPPSRELTVAELDSLLDSEEGVTSLEAEFEAIRGGKRRPWTEGEKPENLWKNRYQDLLAFDDTRVRLPYKNRSDYINANYVSGYHGEKEYIATQGPLANTTADFWAMVWHENVSRIVMLANLVEHGESKVSKYWPDSFVVHEGLLVTRLGETRLPALQHVMRTFLLVKPGSGVRVVRQFHFTGWPDLGVPDDRTSVLALVAQARKAPGKGPILVHCSAGVGRTGTVILLDSMIERAKSEGLVDFPTRLDAMRRQRVDAVEKKEQYVFAHRAVAEMFRDATVAFLREADGAYRGADFGIMGTGVGRLAMLLAAAAMENGFK